MDMVILTVLLIASVVFLYFFIKNYELAANHCDKAIALGYRDVEAEFLDHLEQFRRAKRAEDR